MSVKRNSDGTFKKGTKSPNPGGRKSSKGIASYIFDKTNDLQEIVDIVLEVALKPATSNLEKQDRRWAIDYLTDRALGKPTQVNEVSGLDIVIGLPKELE